jgi:hypothetical protein
VGEYGSWLDSLRPWQESDRAEAQDAIALSSKLWGDREDLERQLLAPSPEIPPRLGLTGLRTLLTLAGVSVRFGERMPVWGIAGIAALGIPKIPEGTRIVARGRRFTVHEARFEIVRRAIESIGSS